MLDPSNKVRSDALECHVIKKTGQTCLVVSISDSLRTNSDDVARRVPRTFILELRIYGPRVAFILDN